MCRGHDPQLVAPGIFQRTSCCGRAGIKARLGVSASWPAGTRMDKRIVQIESSDGSHVPHSLHLLACIIPALDRHQTHIRLPQPAATDCRRAQHLWLQASRQPDESYAAPVLCISPTKPGKLVVTRWRAMAAGSFIRPSGMRGEPSSDWCSATSCWNSAEPCTASQALVL